MTTCQRQTLTCSSSRPTLTLSSQPEGSVTAGLILLCCAVSLTIVYAGLMTYCIVGALILSMLLAITSINEMAV